MKNEVKSTVFEKSICPVTIGRSKCKVNLECELLSKRHCRIDYIDDKFFYIDGSNGKPSTNGTW